MQVQQDQQDQQAQEWHAPGKGKMEEGALSLAWCTCRHVGRRADEEARIVPLEVDGDGTSRRNGGGGNA